jgi:hypothetical protein
VRRAGRIHPGAGSQHSTRRRMLAVLGVVEPTGDLTFIEETSW